MRATCAAHTLQEVGLHNNLKSQIHSVFRPVHLTVPSDSKVSVFLSNASLHWEKKQVCIVKPLVTTRTSKRMYVFCVDLRTTAIISLYSITDWLL